MPFLLFLSSPLGRVLAIGAFALVVVVGAWFQGDEHGANRVQAEWTASREAARIEKARLDKVAAENAAARDAANTAAEAAIDTANTEARDEFIKGLEAHRCVLDSGALERLRLIK